jgi:hypothetical protein
VQTEREIERKIIKNWNAERDKVKRKMIMVMMREGSARNRKRKMIQRHAEGMHNGNHRIYRKRKKF